MNRKMDHLCLDPCKIEPKLIKEMGVMAQHFQHDYQSIEKINLRLNEPDNLKIVNEFLDECSLDSLLSQNETFKQEILKSFQINVDQFFDDIVRIQVENWKNNKLIEGTLRSIMLDSQIELLNSIEGDFKYLKKENIGLIQSRMVEQKQRNMIARNEIDLLRSQIGNLFKRFQPKTIIQWEEDENQDKRLNQVTKSKSRFDFFFEKERHLIVKMSQKYNKIQQDILSMVQLCIEFQPHKLTIELNLPNQMEPYFEEHYELFLEDNLKAISPLGNLKALVDLAHLNINFGFQYFLYQSSDFQLPEGFPEHLNNLSELKLFVK